MREGNQNAVHTNIPVLVGGCVFEVYKKRDTALEPRQLLDIYLSKTRVAECAYESIFGKTVVESERLETAYTASEMVGTVSLGGLDVPRNEEWAFVVCELRGNGFRIGKCTVQSIESVKTMFGEAFLM